MRSPTTPAEDPLAVLGVRAGRLIDRLAGVSLAWYAAHPAGLTATRAELLRELVGELAVLGREAGTGAPVGAVPPRLGDHALRDQVIVLVADLRGAPRGAEFATRATAAVRTCDDRLWGAN